MKGLSRQFSFRVSGSRAHYRANRGFTLIELLVVIAIIALLLSIIVPSLNLAKRKAATAVCLIDAKNLSLAWYNFQSENDGKLALGNVGKDCWVGTPELENGTPLTVDSLGPPVTDEDEKRGIVKGTLYPYLEATDVFHCPADQRKSKWDQSKIFRTYSIPAALYSPIRKFAQISQPGVRYNFLEEADARNFNMGTWSFKTPKDLGPGQWEWQDVLAVNHGDSSILGFCDGHAEVHKWVDAHTKERVKVFFEDPTIRDTAQLNTVCPRPPGTDTDLMYMAQGWADRKF